MSRLKLFIFLLVNTILQTTVFSRIQFFGVHTNLSLVIIVYLALFYGHNTGGFYGLAVGLIEDLLFLNVIGVRALIYFIVGYYLGINNRRMGQSTLKYGVVSAFFVTLLFAAYYGIALWLLGQQGGLISMVKVSVLIEGLLNAAFFVLVHLFLDGRFGLKSSYY